MKSNFEVNVKTEEILKELDGIYGTDQCKEVIRNYASYIEMKKRGEVEFGNYNILIRNQSEYGASEQLVEVIWKILKANQIHFYDQKGKEITKESSIIPYDIDAAKKNGYDSFKFAKSM